MTGPRPRVSRSARAWLILMALAAPCPADEPADPPFHRRVTAPSNGGNPPAVLVTEFITHGALDPRGEHLAVLDGRRQPVPWRLLQVGPGDLCRLAIQTVPGQRAYRIEYGPALTPGKPPDWTARPGLLLETRAWRDANLNDPGALRSAFEGATPIGSDYVPTVYHALNPFQPGPIPFLSRYSGPIQIPRPGKYAFFTSSQDASFLSIDGKPVVAAPGLHGPAHQARHRGEVELTPGLHAFEYLHAAAGPDAMMVAAWQPPGASKPEPIPPEAFGAREVAHVPAAGPFYRSDRSLHDFALKILGEVELTTSGTPMVRVQFFNLVDGEPSANSRARWDFGDGQTSSQPHPVHVYLHPGTYKVTLSAQGEATGLTLASTVAIPRAAVFAPPPDQPPADQLSAYLSLMAGYDPEALDPAGFLQLVRAHDEAGDSARALRLASAWIRSKRAGADEAVLLTLARLACPRLRDHLGDPRAAVELWLAVAQAATSPAAQAEARIEAADLLTNDLLEPDPAGPLLDAAASQLGTAAPAPDLLARLQGTRGDLLARRGERDAATAAYAESAQARTLADPNINLAQQQARRGAFTRSAEAFLRDRDLDRAIAELRAWNLAFPADKLDGALTYLMARYWGARQKPDIVTALASDLVALNPTSAYADHILLASGIAQAEARNPARARAAFQSLLSDYPGSPLVPDARKRLEALDARPDASPAPAEPPP
jgi:predicted negative regulator of RcsB-dependent stress response